MRLLLDHDVARWNTENGSLVLEVTNSEKSICPVLTFEQRTLQLAVDENFDGSRHH